MFKYAIDGHAHCGIQDSPPNQAFEDYYALVQGSAIKKVVMFAPVMEVYDRFDPFFNDTDQWQQRRQRANAYLTGIGNKDLQVIPYYFIWNDFDLDNLSNEFQGVKWHRHSDEPVYNYSSPACSKALAEIKRRNLPIVLEEELSNTLYFINTLAPEARVIIPHLGGLNGGYRQISGHGVWDLPNVYTDTSLASPTEILDYLENHSQDRIIFGSDFPFGHPIREMQKIESLDLPDKLIQKILFKNLESLLEKNYP